MHNHFELFQLPVQFAIDQSALDRAYHEVQGRVHPDRFANASDSEKRVAMQWATRANEAYKTLKNPFKRAAYLCELHGIDLEVESNTAMPVTFLMQQMEWRETLDDARGNKDAAALDKLEAGLRAERKETLTTIAAQLDAGQFKDAAGLVRQLMFLEKFSEEVANAQDAFA
ncbi:Fe-S protein assembly co-chaperone HscB [uncultured Oxalicibacterium sp.]|uniref:Fe-S protein assembly co-chaperone HscB n=1 Tax=uncultured Oxalicibacterium sp. TaxID=1168540 RepID=UPI0025D9CAF8|nr:Fe-S protein assembly co-chaperone HscB [uncultured Oxalicibacterium sp.]